MARMKHGPYGPIVGKLGGNVGYIRLGQPLVRALKHRTHKPPTELQLAARARMALVSGFIASINPFSNLTFKPKSRQTIGKTAQNLAISANMASAISGEYPDYVLDGTKLVVSEGKLILPGSCAVELAGTQLRFTWSDSSNFSSPYYSDQVMLLAYFPETGEVAFTAGGAKRQAGEDLLQLPGVAATGGYAETYISFISNDRERVSNSLYLGSVSLV